MLDEMKEKFEDSFTDEEKIQIFNLIFSGYYSLSYIRFLAQKKAGRDLGIEVKEPQNLLPPEGEGADYDDYLDAILQQPNKNSILENPNRPEALNTIKTPEVKDDINEDVRIEMPSVSFDSKDEHAEVSHEEVQDSISESPISSSPLEESMLSGELPGAMGPDSSLGEEEVNQEVSDIPEGFTTTRVDGESIEEKEDVTESSEELTIKEEPVEEKEPLSPTIDNEEKSDEVSEEDKKEENDIITFGFGESVVGEAHEPTIEVIQEDTRPKKEESAEAQIRFVAPDEVTNGESNTNDNMPADVTVVLPTSAETPVQNPQPTIEIPTISIEDLTNPKPQGPSA